MVLGIYQVHITADGGGEVGVVRGSDGELR